MDTIFNTIAVPGWNTLKTEHPTRALTLQALTNLELAYYLGQKPQRPTRKEILAEVIRTGRDLSDASLQTIQRHLDTLAETGHVIKGDEGKSPWRSRYIALKEK